MIKTPQRGGPRGRPWLMEGCAGVAVVLSIVLAAIGVSGLVGWASPYAVAGSLLLIAFTTLAEVVACRLPIHAEARAREGGWSGWIKAALTVAGFVVLTLVNLAVGHMGLKAIDAAGVADGRAPFVQRLAQAEAAETAAKSSLAAHDKAAADAQAVWAKAQDQVDVRYVTAGTKRLAAAEAAAKDRAQARALLVDTLAKAEAAAKTAKAEMARAPNPRPDLELWGVALVLEILKGALMWFATPATARRALAKNVIELTPVGEMSDDELERLASQAASWAALVRHEKRRRAA
jgi:hypothetical protein